MIKNLLLYLSFILSFHLTALEYTFDLTYLYMQSFQDHLAYAVSSENTSISSPPLNGKVLLPEFQWQNAIAASASILDETSQRGMKTDWMHYISHNSTNSYAPKNGTLFPTQSVTPSSLSGPEISSLAQSTWSLTFDSLNLLYFVDLSSDHMFPTYLNTGIQLNWIRETFDVQYNDVINQQGSKNVTHSNQSINSWGIGPMIGMNFFYYFYEGFHLLAKTYGAISFSPSLSKIKITNEDMALDIGRPNQPILSLKRKKNLMLKPNAEVGLGFGWSSLLDQYEMRLYFSAEYDLFIWFNQNQFLNFNDDVTHGTFYSSGNLYIHGLAAKASVIF